MQFYLTQGSTILKHGGGLRKCWTGFKIAKVDGDTKKMEYYAKGVILIEHGYNVILVNPAITTEILGKKSYPSITDVPDKIDIVDVFRRSEDVPAVIEDAIQKKDGIKVIWMQSGIYNEEAERKAKQNGLDVVYDRCMITEHRR